MAKFGDTMRGLSVFITDIRNCEGKPHLSRCNHYIIVLPQARARRQRERGLTRSWPIFGPSSKVRRFCHVTRNVVLLVSWNVLFIGVSDNSFINNSVVLTT